MTNLQLLLAIGIPSFLVLVNMAIGTWAIKELRAEMHRNNDSLRAEIHGNNVSLRAEIKELRSEMIVRLDRVDADLRTFYAITGKLEGRLDTLEKR